jgi:hypothetical protein
MPWGFRLFAKELAHFSSAQCFMVFGLMPQVFLDFLAVAFRS